MGRWLIVLAVVLGGCSQISDVGQDEEQYAAIKQQIGRSGRLVRVCENGTTIYHLGGGAYWAETDVGIIPLDLAIEPADVCK